MLVAEPTCRRSNIDPLTAAPPVMFGAPALLQLLGHRRLAGARLAEQHDAPVNGNLAGPATRTVEPPATRAVRVDEIALIGEARLVSLGTPEPLKIDKSASGHPNSIAPPASR
jgi:hypothetical protein